MPWVRIDENAMDHPKVAGLPGETFKLWVQGLAHCQKFLTDGLIDRVSLRGLRSYSPKRLAEIVDARLWTTVDDGAVQVHDYLEWNDSREHVLKVRAQGRDRIRKLRGRNASGNGVTAREHEANDLRSSSGGVACSTQPVVAIERERGSGRTIPPGRTGSGVMAGMLPRDHMNCRQPCIRVCLSEKQHVILRERHGGTDAELDAFYAEVRGNLNGPVGQRPWEFWESQFIARFGGHVDRRTVGNEAAKARFLARGAQ